MKRSIALAALLAVSLVATAVMASSAAAAGFQADDYTATVKGQGSGDGAHDFAFDAFQVYCAAQTFQSSLDQPRETLDASPAKAQCVVGGSGSVSANDCELTFHPETEVAAGTFDGSLAIGPESCTGISIEVEHETGWECEATLQPQSGLSTTYTTTGSGSSQGVDIEVDASDVEYTQTAPPLGSGCESGSFEDGTWSGTWAVSAYNAEANQIGMRVSDTIPIPIGIQGEESEVPGEQPRLTAEQYSVVVEGEQLEADEHELVVNAGTISCDTATFGEELAGASAELVFAPAYAGCVFEPYGPTVFDTNGCQLALDIANVGPPYSADAAITCPEGEAIEATGHIFGIVKCKITVPAQTLGSVPMQNSGSGWSVLAELNLTGIEYVQEQGEGFEKCSSPGTYTNGKYTGTISMAGLR